MREESWRVAEEHNKVSCSAAENRCKQGIACVAGGIVNPTLQVPEGKPF